MKIQNLTDLNSQLTKHPTSNFETSWTLTPNQSSILIHNSECNTKFTNRNPHTKSRERTIQETSEGPETKMERSNPILLIYASLHRYDGVKRRPQATHPKMTHTREPYKIKVLLRQNLVRLSIVHPIGLEDIFSP